MKANQTTQKETTEAILAGLPDGLYDRAAIIPIIWKSKESQPCLRTLDRLTTAKKIPSIKLGGQRLYSPRQVMASLLAQARGGFN